MWMQSGHQSHKGSVEREPGHPGRSWQGDPWQLFMASKRLKCFNDTGSSVSLIKHPVVSGLWLALRERTARVLAGIAGQGLHTIEERNIRISILNGQTDCQFLGDILTCIDFPRRFYFALQHDKRSNHLFLGVSYTDLSVTFTDSPSLSVLAVKMKHRNFEFKLPFQESFLLVCTSENSDLILVNLILQQFAFPTTMIW